MSSEVPIIILILAIPTYFFCIWLMTKLKVANEKNRGLIALISTVILSPLIYVGIIVIWIFSISYYPSNEFDKSEWDSNTEERYKMSEDIIESTMLLGKTQGKVIQI